MHFKKKKDMFTQLLRICLFVAMINLFCLSSGARVSANSSYSIPTSPLQDDEIDEMKLIQQLDDLQIQLESPDITERDEAERQLISLGPLVLDYLDVPEQLSTDAKQRIARVRRELEKQAVIQFTQPTLVNLKGRFSLEDGLAEIRKQTGNNIFLHGRLPAEIAEKESELDFSNASFWEAVRTIMQSNQLTIDPFAGGAGQIRLAMSARRGLDFPLLKVDSDFWESIQMPHSYAGVFDFSVNRTWSQLDFVNPAASSTNVTLAVRWEPRLQPISLDLPFRSIVMIDDQDNQLSFENPDRVFHGVVQPEIPELEINLPLRIHRGIKKIKSLEAELLAVLPGRMETFRFRKIGLLTEGFEQQKAGATVVYEGVRKNQDLYGVAITLKFDESFNALESHRGWAYDNPIYLEDDEGNQLEPLTLEGLRQSEDAVTIRYYFREDPQDYALVYKTVAAIIEHPVKFRLENIILP